MQCEKCSQIDWGTLRCPTFRELRELGTDARIHFDADVAKHPHIRLGSLRRIKESGSRCPVCHLLWTIMVRNNGDQEPDLTDPSAGDRDIECFARMQWFGQFTTPGETPLQDTDIRDDRIGRAVRKHLVRRLSLRIGVPAAYTEDEEDCQWSYILFFIQACPVNTSSVPPMTAFGAPLDMPAFVFGGRRRPRRFEIDWLRQWLDLCASTHTAECGAWPAFQNSGSHCPQQNVNPRDPNDSSLPVIRLINVSSKCFEAFGSVLNSETAAIPPYVALSYVWGKDQVVKLCKSNMESLARPGALEDQKPSKSITDAMDLLLGLRTGITYLWVDAICIVQDSDEDKALHIGRMGRIYAAADFTIVVASGEDADAGLPGLREGTRSIDQSAVEVIAPGARTYSDKGLKFHQYGLSIMDTLTPLWDEDDDFWTTEKYATRGWTMQERVLSRRKLIFTKEQVYWQCATASYCEESVMEPDITTLKPLYSGGAITV
ncbi:hypothetical protein AC578_9023 [Pseudocercospora eumusae]|uniref:Heterokaryon incompatibility domain-containing protein n=1 Tax=Pseudocercospora eumusae TaxID=321146 RepID=A0A139H307_9PEZI|nr:hypothetical protein AC578_9023 [Pseudocercospora eumusae]